MPLDMNSLRCWLTGLDDAMLGEVLWIPTQLPYAAGIRVDTQQRAHWKARQLRSARAYLHRASSRDLLAIAQQAAAFATHMLAAQGRSPEELKQPERETLEQMLSDLPPALARFTCYSLLNEEPSLAQELGLTDEELLACADRLTVVEAHACARDEVDAAGSATDRLSGEQVHERVTVPPLTAGAEDLADELAALRQAASELAEDLRDAARLADGGSHLPAGLGDAITAFNKSRSALADQLAEAGGDKPAEAAFWTFDDFDRARDRVAAAEEEARLQRAQMEQLRERIAKYDALLAGEDDEDARTALAMVRDKYASQLAAIGAPIGEEASPPASAAAAAQTAECEASAPEQTVSPAPSPASANPSAAPSPASASPSPDVEQASRQEVPEQVPAAGGQDRTPIAPEPDVAVQSDHEQTEVDVEDDPAPYAATVEQSLTDAAPGNGTEPDSIAADHLADVLEGGGAREGDRAPVLTWTDTDQRPGPVASLVLRGRLAEAYWLTKGSDESELRAEALAFVAAAFACTTESAGTDVLSAFNRAAADFRDDRSAQIAVTVASLRAGFVAGWPNDLLNQLDTTAALPQQWAAFVEAAVHTVRHSQRVNPTSVGLGQPTPGVTREQIGAQARELLTDLPRRRTSYQRATQVLARLAAANQPLGSTLQVIMDWAAGTATAADLDAAAPSMSDPDQLIADADILVRNPKQAKEPIEAKARRSLLRAITSVSELLDQARNIAASQAGNRPDVAATLRTALPAVAAAPRLPGVDGALLDLLRRWLRGEFVVADQDTIQPEDFPEDLADYRPDSRPLLALTDLPRHPNGSPAPEAEGFAPAVLGLLAPIDTTAATLTHCKRGDVHLAEALTSAVTQGAVPCAEDNGTTEDLSEEIETAHTQWSGRLRTAHTDASGLLAELRIQRTLEPAAERELTGELVRLEEARPAGAYRPAIEQIGALTERMHTAVRAYAVKLRAEFAALDLDERTRAEVEKLLDMHDTATAEEYLSLIKRGEPLPDWGTVDWGEDLTAFWTGLDLPGNDGRLQQGYSAGPWARHYAGDNGLTEGVEPALEAWDALCDASVRNQEWQRHLPRVLRLLGLEVEPATLNLTDRSVGQIRATLRAKPSESRPGYVASLGSDARGRYKVVIVADKQVGRSVLDLLDDTDNTATLVLYLHPMGMAGRRTLAARARSGMRQALVVDPAVIGWMVARYPRSFRAAQRVTLPWTAFNTYTPFVAGLVPAEVFYGRRDEMSQVIDPRGGQFLYGGRQLGKSALLRRVEDTYSTDRHKVVFLDLKARGIGEAEPAERIWDDLAAELHRRGVLDRPASTDTPDTVVDRIEAWLAADLERRLLVLLDEADSFLTADSRSVHSRGGEVTFPNVLRLKRLSDDNQRRFKVVFAGLHQVQRFGHLSNVPLTHGGPDILVGPLNPSEAQRLVVEPMAALGFVFERPELAWRVLAATNFQASLVQIFCDQLVSALRTAPVTDGIWPVVVTEADMRGVSASPRVRAQIAERMRITINLEDRYRVLTLTIALRSQQDEYRDSYGAGELLHEARERWPEGFRDLTVAQVQIYLEEMVGLGLLVSVSRSGDNPSYTVRSPNVVSMLGTPEALEQELTETEFRLPYEYNPRLSRRMVGQGRNGVQHYSPLTEAQLFSLTGPGISAVCVTNAFQPMLLINAVQAYAAARGITVARSTGAELPRHLGPEPDADHLLLVDLREADQGQLTAALDLLGATDGAEQAAHRAVLLVDPAGVRLRTDAIGNAIRLERWNADSLRAWPECPFDTPQQRQALVEATGGWPSLVEVVVHQITRTGTTLENALDRIRTATAAPDTGRSHLDRVGLDTELAELLVQWTQLLDEPEPDTPARIADIIGVSEEEILDVVSRLADLGVIDQSDDGIALDPVTFRALVATTAGA
ncbi:AAA family ATPase [Streptomyces vinaceus]|uniref:AAA family ATPase n=1 Tax=Streptomyces vinaceus TaxID=1960 RepID=UPI0037FE796C